MTAKSVVMDSSVWIEILNGGALAKSCQKEMAAAELILVPTTVIFEVYRKISSLTSEDRALSAIAALSQHSVVELSREVALLAGDLSLAHKLAMADSFVLAHAQHEGAILLTLDNDFSELPDAKVLRK